MDAQDLVREMREWGASQADIEQALAAHRNNEPAPLMVQPANALIVSVFNVVCRYWVRGGMDGRPVNLDISHGLARLSQTSWYPALESEVKAAIWDGLDIMEQACLSAWAERDNK